MMYLSYGAVEPMSERRGKHRLLCKTQLSKSSVLWGRGWRAHTLWVHQDCIRDRKREADREREREGEREKEQDRNRKGEVEGRRGKERKTERGRGKERERERLPLYTIFVNVLLKH